MNGAGSSHARLQPTAFIPVALLIAIVGFHGFQIVVHDDDPQRSAAFAMFATVDIGATRRVIATANEGDVTLEIPTALAGPRNALADRPSADAASELASMLLDARWDIRGTMASTGGTTVLDEIRIRVVGFATEGRTFTRQVLTDVTLGSGS